jgi:hypothetical protein
MGLKITGNPIDTLTIANDVLEPYLKFQAQYTAQKFAELQECKSGKNSTPKLSTELLETLTRLGIENNCR